MNTNQDISLIGDMIIFMKRHGIIYIRGDFAVHRGIELQSHICCIGKYNQKWRWDKMRENETLKSKTLSIYNTILWFFCSNVCSKCLKLEPSTLIQSWQQRLAGNQCGVWRAVGVLARSDESAGKRHLQLCFRTCRDILPIAKRQTCI